MAGEEKPQQRSIGGDTVTVHDQPLSEHRIETGARIGPATRVRDALQELDAVHERLSHIEQQIAAIEEWRANVAPRPRG